MSLKLAWKRGRKTKSKSRKRVKLFSAFSERHSLKVYATKSGWVGKITTRRMVWEYGSNYKTAYIEDSSEPPILVGPSGDSLTCRIACEVWLSLQEK